MACKVASAIWPLNKLLKIKQKQIWISKKKKLIEKYDRISHKKTDSSLPIHPNSV